MYTTRKKRSCSVRLDRIYTKIGDHGKTHLANGEKVNKYDVRIEAYGTVDELNAAIGLVRDHLMLENSLMISDICSKLSVVQNELFDLGGELATPSHALNVSVQQVVGTDAINRLELEMDQWNASLPPLKNFVLPGGHPTVSFCHLARCICRRAERRIFSLNEQKELRPEAGIYLNRLSDWLFVLGRAIAQELKINEVIWQQRGK